MTEIETCSVPGCGEPVHLRGVCREHYVRQRRGEARRHPRSWSPEEDRRLIYILDSAPDGLGHAEAGELDEIADMIGRTRDATGQRLTTLRRIRKEHQTAAIVGIPRRARRADGL